MARRRASSTGEVSGAGSASCSSGMLGLSALGSAGMGADRDGHARRDPAAVGAGPTRVRAVAEHSGDPRPWPSRGMTTRLPLVDGIRVAADVDGHREVADLRSPA